jgi:GH25 family lysozyme M1 (1,4-beta-N-acetylmuramidase)
MGFIFKAFKIIGIDLSKYNDNPDTPQVVDPQKVVDTGIDFVAMRSTVGKWLDPKFKQFWAALRGFVLRIQYHYMDYYSHTGLGLTAEQWGQVQAQAVFDSTKDDNDGCPAFLDIEKASFAARIEDVLPLVQSIAKAFLVKLDVLNGKKNGLYLSLSYIKYFLFAASRPLWLAWYNEYYTPEQAIKFAREKGWAGPIYIWQYASDGDIDDDGIADGLKIGVESRAVDLNIWIGTEEEFNNFGKVTGTTPEPPVVLEISDAEKLKRLWAAHPELHLM